MALEAVVRMESSLSSVWKRWIAENKLQGIEDEMLIEILVNNGVERQSAERGVSGLASHPYFEAGEWIAQRLRKLESLLHVYHELASLAPAARFRTIERRSNVSQDEFLDRYYSRNRPIVLLGLLSNWKAVSRWNPDYLRATCGQEIVEVMGARESDPRYEVNANSHRMTMSFREYVDLVERVGKSNDYYLVANNKLLERDGMKHLYDDMEPFPEYLDPQRRKGNVFFWFGPSGTVTPLHHDLLNIFMAQVYGRKRVTLISPNQTPLLYNDIGVFSELDPANPDYERFPKSRDVEMVNLILRPGEILFLPVGWWHRVEALDVSITVSASNFIFPNRYRWDNPHIQRK